MRHGGKSCDHLIRGDGLNYTRAPYYHDPVPYLQVIREAYLTSYHHLTSDMNTPRDPHLGDHDRIFSNDHVVAYVHLVICLNTPLYPCLPKSGPINAVIGPEFHMVIYLNNTELGNLYVDGSLANKSETITSDYTTGMDNYLIPDNTIVQNSDIWIDDRFFPNLYPVTYKGS